MKNILLTPIFFIFLLSCSNAEVHPNTNQVDKDSFLARYILYLEAIENGKLLNKINFYYSDNFISSALAEPGEEITKEDLEIVILASYSKKDSIKKYSMYKEGTHYCFSVLGSNHFGDIVFTNLRYVNENDRWKIDHMRGNTYEQKFANKVPQKSECAAFSD